MPQWVGRNIHNMHRAAHVYRLRFSRMKLPSVVEGSNWYGFCHRGACMFASQTHPSKKCILELADSCVLDCGTFRVLLICISAATGWEWILLSRRTHRKLVDGEGVLRIRQRRGPVQPDGPGVRRPLAQHEPARQEGQQNDEGAAQEQHMVSWQKFRLITFKFVRQRSGAHSSRGFGEESM